MEMDRSYQRRKGKDFQVKLTCGCSLRMTNYPMDRNQKFGCPGAGHGYNVGWVTSTRLSTGTVSHNPKTKEN